MQLFRENLRNRELPLHPRQRDKLHGRLFGDILRRLRRGGRKTLRANGVSILLLFLLLFLFLIRHTLRQDFSEGFPKGFLKAFRKGFYVFINTE